MLYAGVAARAFRRYSTYGWATLAGVFTNCVFGVIISYVYIAVWDANETAGGYQSSDALTYAWLGQAMIMTTALWGGGSPDDLAERIKSGDIALDFYRPVGILGWYVAADLGRAAYHLLGRGIPPTILGAVLFDLTWPDGAVTWLVLAVSIVLAVLVSFGVRFLVALSAFWLLDDTGVKTLAALAAMFLTGLSVPLVLFPDGLREVAMLTPWAAYLQIPADIWLGHPAGGSVWAGLALQAGWAILLLGCCRAVLVVAERRVVVQGG